MTWLQGGDWLQWHVSVACVALHFADMLALVAAGTVSSRLSSGQLPVSCTSTFTFCGNSMRRHWPFSCLLRVRSESHIITRLCDKSRPPSLCAFGPLTCTPLTPGPPRPFVRPAITINCMSSKFQRNALDNLVSPCSLCTARDNSANHRRDLHFARNGILSRANTKPPEPHNRRDSEP